MTNPIIPNCFPEIGFAFWNVAEGRSKVKLLMYLGHTKTLRSKEGSTSLFWRKGCLVNRKVAKMDIQEDEERSALLENFRLRLAP